MKPARTVPLEDFAGYAGDLLESLWKMARQQDQLLLAHLLALAVVEARSLAPSRARRSRRADAA